MWLAVPVSKPLELESKRGQPGVPVTPLASAEEESVTVTELTAPADSGRVPLVARETSQHIQVRVEDYQGAVVPGATVEVIFGANSGGRPLHEYQQVHELAGDGRLDLEIPCTAVPGQRLYDLTLIAKAPGYQRESSHRAHIEPGVEALQLVFRMTPSGTLAGASADQRSPGSDHGAGHTRTH